MNTKTEHALQPKSTGTTIIGIRTKDAVILAADQKATEGYLVAQKYALKIHPVAGHIGMAWAGNVGDAQTFHKHLQAQARTYQLEHRKEISIEQLVSYASTFLNYNRYYPYYVGLIVGGYSNNAPVLYDLDPFGAMLESKDYTASGSGGVIAYGVLEDKYRDDLSLDEAIKVAVRAVRAAKERDVFSGGVGINVVIIDKNGYKELEAKEVEKHLSAKKE